MAQKISWLDFLGINYRANVWLNGKKIADAKDVAGTFGLSSSTSARLCGREKPTLGRGNIGAGKRTT